MKIILRILFVCGIILSQVTAKGADAYVNALVLYQDGKYKKAYPIILAQAKKGNKEAQYLLGTMLEKGEGVAKNKQKAMYWYKQASSKFSYIREDNKKHKLKRDSSFSNRLKNQLKYSTSQKGANYAFTKVDLSTSAVKSKMMKILENSFGMQPYKTNYIVPFSYASTSYRRHFSAYLDSNIPVEWQDGVAYDSHIEAEMQLSFQKPLIYNLFGWHEYINFAYTQKFWWKIYDESAPFRETNYMPELFMILPTSDHMDKQYNLKGIKFGYRHHSNGQEGYKSRSWDRLYLESIWQWDNLFVSVQTWYRIPEDRKSEAFYQGIDPNDKGDDNPDILDYMGYGELTIKYLYGKSQINVMLRNNFNFKDNKGAVEVDWTTPFFNSENTYWYIRGFSGYGESLIDYNRYVNKISFGFAFSRGIF
ncbi:MAG: phospholipase A [Sulfurovum sp.]|nr:phospholipase A [Sulfurovum sp.]